jgi:hypothetical protein
VLEAVGALIDTSDAITKAFPQKDQMVEILDPTSSF